MGRLRGFGSTGAAHFVCGLLALFGAQIMRRLSIEYLPISRLKPRTSNPRTHSDKQIDQIARSIQRFGFTNPIIADDEANLVAGEGRLKAAKRLGFSEVPVVRLEDMTEAQIRAYVIADNKLAENAGWDRNLLALELQYLSDLGLDDLDITGFELPEIEVLMSELTGADSDGSADEVIEPTPGPAITRVGDVWRIGDHRLVCGDSARPETYQVLLADKRAQMVFSDPPYNVPIAGHVGGLGKIQHREVRDGLWGDVECRIYRVPNVGLFAARELFRKRRHPFSVHRLAPYR